MRFYIETFGCTSNFGNSQDLAEALQEMGHVPSGLEEADVVIVNTCAVTERTERKVLRRLRQLDGKRLVVAGCLAAASPDSISKIGCLGSIGVLKDSSAERISEILEQSPALLQQALPSYPSLASAPKPLPSASKSLPSASNQLLSPSPSIVPPSLANAMNLCRIVNVAEGCTGRCSYCIVRKARGPLCSRPLDDIIARIRSLAAEGVAEVQLAAQDIAAYGLDLDASLAGLLENAAQVPGRFRLRVGMMNPKNIPPQQNELIKAFKSPKIYKFLHIPVQSGSDDILLSMGREYKVREFLEIAQAFRESFEDITIITDIITGFPGETEDDFNSSARLLELLQPDKVNVTRFSSRQGTIAADMYDMPDRIKKDRSRVLTEMWMQIASERNSRYLGRVLPCVVVEEGRKGTMKGRTANYQGVVIEEKVPLGSSLMVEITSYNSFYLSGRAIN